MARVSHLPTPPKIQGGGGLIFFSGLRKNADITYG